MKNKFIYISSLGRVISYADFDAKLKAEDPELLALFPGLKESEKKKKTCDDLFNEAVQPVVDAFWDAYGPLTKVKGEHLFDPVKIKAAYKAITDQYDKHSLRSYLTEVADWSEDAIDLYDLGNAHVVFENGFIESWKDAFLSSNDGGEKAGMTQLKNGMDQVPNAFISMTNEEKNSEYCLKAFVFANI